MIRLLHPAPDALRQRRGGIRLQDRCTTGHTSRASCAAHDRSDGRLSDARRPPQPIERLLRAALGAPRPCAATRVWKLAVTGRSRTTRAAGRCRRSCAAGSRCRRAGSTTGTRTARQSSLDSHCTEGHDDAAEDTITDVGQRQREFESRVRRAGRRTGAALLCCVVCVVWSNEAAAVHGAPVTSGRDLFYRQRDRHLLSMLRSG